MFRGGEYGARTPTELRETRGFDWRTEIGIPFLQAASIALSVAITLTISPIAAILSAGEATGWLFTGIWALTTFLWYLKRSANLVTEEGAPIVEEYDQEVRNTLVIMEIAVGVAMALMVGGVAFCFHKVLEQINPTRPEWLTGWIALVGIAQFPAFVVLSIFLILSFGQELAQRSPHQELFVWQALGKLLEGFGSRAVTNYWYDPPILNYRRTSDNDKSPTLTPRQAPTNGEIQTAALVEFIRRGEKIGYTRSTWAEGSGTRLEATGAKMRVKEWREFTEGLRRANIMGDVNGETGLLCSVEEALAHVSHPSFSLEGGSDV